MRFRWLYVPLVFALAVTAGVATAQESKLYTTISGAELASVFQQAGFRATLSADSVGDPMIESSAQGVNFRVIFYGCDSSEPKRCDSLMFRVGFNKGGTLRYEQINQWNRSRRYGMAYLDDEMDPWLEMNVLISGGVSEANLLEQTKTWDNRLGHFLRHIDW